MTPQASAARPAERGELLFGTIDSCLIWKLTGGPDGGVHVTDVTNASRTMLMDLATLAWDTELLAAFDIPTPMLPEIRSSAEVYGVGVAELAGVPIAGDLGDQHAAPAARGDQVGQPQVSGSWVRPRGGSSRTDRPPPFLPCRQRDGATLLEAVVAILRIDPESVDLEGRIEMVPTMRNDRPARAFAICRFRPRRTASACSANADRQRRRPRSHQEVVPRDWNDREIAPGGSASPRTCQSAGRLPATRRRET